MSRFSVFVHEHFGTGAANETVADIIVRHIPDTAQFAAVKEIVSDAVAVMEGTGISGEEKRKLVTAAVHFALAALHITLPGSIVSFLIEEAVVMLKGGKVSTPVTPPVPPVGDPYAFTYATADEAKAAGKIGDRVYGSPFGYRLVYGGAGTVIPSDWTLVATIGG